MLSHHLHPHRFPLKRLVLLVFSVRNHGFVDRFQLEQKKLIDREMLIGPFYCLFLERKSFSLGDTSRGRKNSGFLDFDWLSSVFRFLSDVFVLVPCQKIRDSKCCVLGCCRSCMLFEISLSGFRGSGRLVFLR